MDKFISYGKQFIDDDDIKAVVETLKSDYLTQGPKVQEFEEAICAYTGAKYCVAVANGTAALHLSALALDLGHGEGITTPITFVASANCLLYGGLEPRFCDIDKKTYNISLDCIKKTINDKTKVIVAVDFAGQPADMEEIFHFAKSKGIAVIEDAAHAIGSKYKDGTKVGNCKYSDVTTFSFHPVKTITTGEGGAITTNSEKIYKKLLLLRSHGITKSSEDLSQNPGPWYYEMQELGFNYRLSDVQAALGVSQLNKLESFVKRRREIVSQYNKAFSTLKNTVIPYERSGLESAFHLYVLKIDFKAIGKSRKDFMLALHKKGVGSQVHYIPVHFQPYYQNNFSNILNNLPVAEKYYEQCLSLPLYPAMSDEDTKHVIETVEAMLVT